MNDQLTNHVRHITNTLSQPQLINIFMDYECVVKEHNPYEWFNFMMMFITNQPY